MLPTLLILAFAALMITAIWLSRLATRKHREEIEQKRRARTLRERLNEIANVSLGLLEYDGDKALLESVTDFRIQQIRKRLDLLDEDDSEGELAAATAFRDTLDEKLAERQSGLPTSDAGMSDMKKKLFKAIKLIKLMQAQGYFMDSEVADHVARLRIIMLKTEVNAYIQQGRNLLKDEDRVNAASHFKHAKELLVASNLRFPERSSMIKRISKMIWGVYSTREDDEALDRELGLSADQREELREAAEDEVDSAENESALEDELQHNRTER